MSVQGMEDEYVLLMLHKLIINEKRKEIIFFK